MGHAIGGGAFYCTLGAAYNPGSSRQKSGWAEWCNDDHHTKSTRWRRGWWQRGRGRRSRLASCLVRVHRRPSPSVSAPDDKNLRPFPRLCGRGCGGSTTSGRCESGGRGAEERNPRARSCRRCLQCASTLHPGEILIDLVVEAHVSEEELARVDEQDGEEELASVLALAPK